MNDKIKCPKCGHAFAPSEEESRRVREELEARYRERSEALESAAEEARKKLEEDLKARRARLDRESKEAVASQLEDARRVAWSEAKAESEARLADLDEAMRQKDERLKQAQQNELDLRRQQRQLEQDKNEFQLELTRKLDAERSKIVEETSRRASEDHAMKEAEWQKQRADLLRQVDEVRRKAEQSSQQAQGEVFELRVESLLKEMFVHDSVEPVAKGVSGGDVLQVVNTKQGMRCGAILWELKRTKAFSEGWVQKLKDDQRDAKADVAVIVTAAMPKGVERIGQLDGVWVVEAQSMVGAALVLRASIMEVAQARWAKAGAKEKAEEAYEYLNGVEFRGRVQALVESFSAMKEDLDAERRAIEKAWSKREKQLTRSVLTMAGMYGELQAVMGQSLPEIKALSLEARE